MACDAERPHFAENSPLGIFTAFVGGGSVARAVCA
jgi:hypothetical protein